MTTQRQKKNKSAYVRNALAWYKIHGTNLYGDPEPAYTEDEIAQGFRLIMNLDAPMIAQANREVEIRKIDQTLERIGIYIRTNEFDIEDVIDECRHIEAENIYMRDEQHLLIAKKARLQKEGLTT
jgi:hypothetical protein